MNTKKERERVSEGGRERGCGFKEYPFSATQKKPSFESAGGGRKSLGILYGGVYDLPGAGLIILGDVDE